MELNKTHYNITQPRFYQLYFDRLVSYLGVVHSATIQQIKFTPTHDLEIICTNRHTLLPLLNNIFQAFEKDGKIVVPNHYVGNYQTIRAIWLFCPKLFDPSENLLIFESFVHFFYGRTFPRQFATQFLKYLNRIFDLQDVIRKSGVSSVEFTPRGVVFTWPIYYTKLNSNEVLKSNLAEIEFVRDEINKIEQLTVPYAYAWEAITGTNWSGELSMLTDFNKTLDQHFSKVEVDKYSYCADRIQKQFGLAEFIVEVQHEPEPS